MSAETLKSERRKKSRQRPLALVYVELASQNGGMMRDLSEEGFAVRVMIPLRVGDKTPFSFSLNEFIHIDGEGSVLWVAEKGRVAGLKFTQITPTARAQIHRWLNGPGDTVPEKTAEERTVTAETPTLEQLREELRASPPRPQTARPSQKPEQAPAAETVPTQVAAVASAPVASDPVEAKKPEPQVEVAAQREEESAPPAPVEAAPSMTEVASVPTATEAAPELEAPALKSPAEAAAPQAESLPAEPEQAVPAAPEVVASAPAVVERPESRELAEPEPVAESSVPQTEAPHTLTDHIVSTVPEVVANAPDVAESAKPAEAQPGTLAAQTYAENVAPPAAEPAPSPREEIANAPTVAELPDEKVTEPQSGWSKPETVNVASLFTPISDGQDEKQHAGPAAPIWRADGQMQPSASGEAAPTAPAMAAKPPAAAETQRSSESNAGGSNRSSGAQSVPTADTRPKLPRLALRLNAEDYVKQKFPFAVGPPPPPPEPEPVPEPQPKRFWAPAPAAPEERAEQPSPQEPTPAVRDALRAKREVTPAPRPEALPAHESRPSARQQARETPSASWTLPPTAAEPVVQQKSECPQAGNSILPDISSILIQPSGATQRAAAGNSSVLDTLRPWHHEPETKGSWTERFTLPRAIGIMILLVFLVALYAYRHDAGEGLIWLGEQIGGRNGEPQQSEASQVSQPSETSQSNAPADSSSSPVASESGATSEVAPPTNNSRANDSRGKEGHASQSQKSAPNGSGTASTAPQSAKPKKVPPPVIPSTSDFPSTAPEPNTEAGQVEYQQAMQILRGKYQGSALGEAVKLLWVAVEKGSPSAELALADMYWHGKGVARNCDQTRILLTAASRKGSAEAQRRLQEFQQEGCE
jgi:PilZ domain-containing protein